MNANLKERRFPEAENEEISEDVEAAELALLLRAGALAAPMDVIEERTIGPSLGADNIQRGFNSTLWGFVAIAVFMISYYVLFGVISVVALACNVVFLLSLLSILNATLTLPGIAAIALALGMAIDANVLINERIREELRRGVTPHSAITQVTNAPLRPLSIPTSPHLLLV